jgi:hypothetical protein
MYEVSTNIALNCWSLISQSLLVPIDGLLMKEEKSLWWFKSDCIITATNSEIAKLISWGWKYSAFDPFIGQKIDKKKSETWVSYRDGELRVYSRECNSDDTRFESPLQYALDNELLLRVTYEEACENMVQIVKRGDLREDLIFNECISDQIYLLRQKIRDLWLWSEMVLQVHNEEDNGVYLSPEEKPIIPRWGKFEFEYPDFSWILHPKPIPIPFQS